jgi:hypothetical protein
MPNHVSNILTLTGNTDQIKQFVKDIQKEDGTFDPNKLLSCPEELIATISPAKIVSKEEYNLAVEERNKVIENKNENKTEEWMIPYLPLTEELSKEYKEKYGFDNWYDWMNYNYGTKWGLYDFVSQDEENIFYFMTAWSPASPFFKQISARYPEVIFLVEFAEPGNDFIGWEEFMNGEVVSEFTDTFYSEDEETVKLRDKFGFGEDEEFDEEIKQEDSDFK